MTKIKFTDHMKLSTNKDQSMGAFVLLRKRYKIPMEGVTATKCGAETEKNGHPETVPLGGLSHNQPPNTDTIAYASKILLKGP